MTKNSASDASDNLRGILLMLASMGAFAVEDVLIKISATRLPAGQVMISIGLIGALLTVLAARKQGLFLFPRAAFTRLAAVRTVAEMVASISFTLAIVLSDLSSVSAIIQATPLLVTLGGAMFMGHVVGWRRYLAIVIGFGGVLLIIRPGAHSFDAVSLLALLSAVALSVRDLAIRAAPPAVHSLVVAFQGMVVYTLAGTLVLAFSGGLEQVPPQIALWLACAAVLGFGGYLALITSMRAGDVSIISPFRYARLIFGMVAGIAVFGERPDALTYVGAAIVLATGIYTAWREHVRARAAP